MYKRFFRAAILIGDAVRMIEFQNLSDPSGEIIDQIKQDENQDHHDHHVRKAEETEDFVFKGMNETFVYDEEDDELVK